MVDKILALLSALPRELYVLIISMLPIVELRGAVPIGAVLDIPFYLNFILAVVGNIIPVPLILLFIPKLLDLMERVKIFKPIVRWLRGKADKHSKKVLVDEVSDAKPEETAEICGEAQTKPEETVEGCDKAADEQTAGTRKMTKSIFIALMLFVALPIPGTGAWTGSLVASLFDLPKKESFLAVLLGVLICGVIMTLASYGVLGFLSFLI